MSARRLRKVANVLQKPMSSTQRQQFLTLQFAKVDDLLGGEWMGRTQAPEGREDGDAGNVAGQKEKGP